MSRARATMRTTAQIVRGYEGPALFSFGFRPFFLLAGGFAALAVPLWIAGLLGVAGGPLAAAATRDWHVHEMLFGYTGAVIVGYMVIAGANWTGHYPVAGVPVMVLVALWLAGRVAMLWPGAEHGAAILVEGTFLPLFAAALWREQIAARNGRNLIPCLVVTLLAFANLAFHLRFAMPALGPAAERLALGLITLLIMVMGGRLVPSFTQNWLARHGDGRAPAPYDRLDLGAALLIVAALSLWQILPWAPVTGFALILAGTAALLRLMRWRGWAGWREPLLWSLHLGYLWLGVGLALLGLAIVVPGQVPMSSAVHALSAGGIGMMTLTMMMRTTLSHTGRARETGAGTLAALVLVTAAALLRVIAPFAPTLMVTLLAVSALLWSGAFLLFTMLYGPLLVCRRVGRGP